MPGTQKKKDNTKLIITSLSKLPFFRKTANGGKKSERMIKTNLLSTLNPRYFVTLKLSPQPHDETTLGLLNLKL